jgi:hypothetical protein
MIDCGPRMLSHARHTPSTFLHKEVDRMKRLILSIAFLIGALSLAGC